MVPISSISVTQIQQFSFPPKTQKKRDVEKFDQASPWKQTLSDTVSLEDPFQKKLIEDADSIDPEIWQDPTSLVDMYADSIEMHVDERVALFFQTAIVCHKMPLHFESSGEAEEQYGSAPTLKLSKVGGQDHKYEAAHSSTLPSIYACDRRSWEAYKKALERKENPQKPKYFVYCKYAHSYQLQNSTNALPKSVNETDSLIDWKAKGTVLRTPTVKLINETAVGIFDPVQVTKRFVSHFKQRVKALLESPPNAKIEAVLKKYLERIRSIQYGMSTNAQFFDELLNVRIIENERSSVLREVVYKKRFELIRADQLIDSRIKYRVKNASIVLAKGETRDYVKFALIMKATGNERLMLQKLFCKTHAIFNEHYLDSLKGRNDQETLKLKNKYRQFREKVQRFTEKNAKAIDNLLRDIRCDMREMSRSEIIFRAALLRDLIYKVNKWTQTRFVTEFKKKYPNESMSDPMVSRLVQPARSPRKVVYKTPEAQRTKSMTVDKARKCADTLQVEPALFFPCVFTSALSI